MIAIQTENLSKRYGDILAVDQLNLSIEQGETFALLGVNGAGKTTTIKMLSCLLRPSAGDAVILGQRLSGDLSAIKARINLSPQDTAVAPNLSVQENLMFMARIYGQPRRAAEGKARQQARQLGLEPVLNKKARTLSGGMQRRLSLAMALISEPQILFLDEPTLGLDVLARRALWSVITQLKGQVTVVLTSHYMEEVEELADRIGVMARGRLLALGTAGQLRQQTGQSSLEAAFIALTGGAE
ncbi:MAG: ABC transporter ATP-binding protein [Oscillospiraceae bacterium]|nr:ABC transporter ATP-binding protein [Oscillospiraceae bacterium]MDD4368742.1 ABC transporter ATP-binding protein [Oscillospiraceae bacterium]